VWGFVGEKRRQRQTPPGRFQHRIAIPATPLEVWGGVVLQKKKKKKKKHKQQKDKRSHTAKPAPA
jgi:hypothetical protein